MHRVVVLLAAGFLWVPTAGAGTAHDHTPGQKKHRGRALHPTLSTVNMPPGWQWPASFRMVQTGERCLEDLERLGVNYRRVPARVGRIVTPILVEDMMFGGIELVPRYRKKHVMDCHLARALASHGPALMVRGIRKIHFTGIYAMRRARLGGVERRILSRHALGLGIDIGAVTTDDGAVHVVKRHYRRGDTALRDAEQVLASTGGFRAVVTPGNDRAHVDHFHLSARMDILGEDPDLMIEPSALIAATRQDVQNRKRRRRRARQRRRQRPILPAVQQVRPPLPAVQQVRPGTAAP